MLHDELLRRELLLTLGPSELAVLSGSLRVAAEKPFDQALELAQLPWVAGAPAVRAFAGRFAVPRAFLPTRQERLDAIESVPAFQRLPPLFDYQEEIVRQVDVLLETETPSAAVVQMPTGAGKTRTAMRSVVSALLDGSGRGVVWLAHSEELCEQAVETFIRSWQTDGEGEATVARYWGDFRLQPHELSGALVVASYQRLSRAVADADASIDELASGTSLLVIDEAHRTLAPTVRATADHFRTRGAHVIGLTATPGRSTEGVRDNRALASLFDNRLIAPSLLGDDPIHTLIERGILAKVRRVVCDAPIRIAPNARERDAARLENDLPSTLLKRLAENSERNELIVRLVETEVSESRPCLVFACSVEHARELAVHSALNGIRSGHIDCRMRTSTRRSVIRAFRSGGIDAIFNFGVLSTGFDVPRVRTILIARPTSSIVLYSQMIGRGLRGPAVGGTETCELIDIRDNFEAFGDVSAVYNFFQDFWR